MFPFVTLFTQGIFTCAWYITIEIRYVGYFSVAMIKHLDQRQIIEGRVYLSYSSRKSPYWWGSMAACVCSRKLKGLISYYKDEAERANRKWHEALNSQNQCTQQCPSLQPGCTSPWASQQHHQLWTDFQCLNLWGISCSNYHIRPTNQGFTEKN